MVCNKHNTPGIIEFEFWRMAHEWKNAEYICINAKEVYAPEEIGDRYFFLLPSAPVTPCVDSRKAYDGLAIAIESIHDMFFVRFRARHK